MDEVARYNIERWAALVKANALFTRPHLDLDADTARQRVDPDGMFGDLSGRDVLLLGGGGGQQSSAFALLGACVTVVDIAQGQLEGDQQAAEHYGLTITTQQGDMRDLSALGDARFDLVYQPYSLNFVPDAHEVFTQVARVLRPGGMYYLMCANPFAAGMTEADWDGSGYRLRLPYIQGAEITYADADWVYDRSQGGPINGPQEYRQTLSHLVNGLLVQGFMLRRVQELMAQAVSIEAEPGSWDHFTAVVPPWFALWTVYKPDIL